jgi:hypothetical protein
MNQISLDDNCKSHWEADEPQVCGLPPVRIVLGRTYDGKSFLEASEDKQRGERWMHHSVTYYLNNSEIVRLYAALDKYIKANKFIGPFECRKTADCICLSCRVKRENQQRLADANAAVKAIERRRC